VGFSPSNVTTGRRLSELWKTQPADATLQNLLTILGAKLELCSRLPVFEYEAASEHNDRCAAAFHELAERERESFEHVVGLLRQHLDATIGADAPGAER
jgi:hypothetical protein